MFSLLDVIRITGNVDTILFPSGMQFRLEPLNLTVQLFDMCCFGHLAIHLWPVADILGPVGIIQGGQGFLCTMHRGGNCGYDAGFGFATQGIPEQAGQLGITVGHMTRIFHQCSDDTTQGEERLVDQASLVCV